MIRYRVGASDTHAHRFDVQLSIPRPAREQRISLPVWIPGSYLVREFSRHLSGLTARQSVHPEALHELPVEQIDKATWVVRTRGDEPLVVSYRIYAFDTSVRAAFLDAERGFFNGTSVFLRVEGREDEPHAVDLCDLPDGWDVATTLPRVAADPAARAAYWVDARRAWAGERAGTADEDSRRAPADADAAVRHAAAVQGSSFEAQNYAELIDHPVELGRFWRGRFSAGGTEHEFVVSGALPDFDGQRLLADTARICAAQIGFWHGTASAAERPPFARYLFLLNAVDEGHGGLEHRSSTALIAPRRDLPRRPAADEKAGELADGYVALLGLISHEYFHAWNVKRLRPSEFERYDYTRENYTALLWFFEGFTSYYDDLFLRRCGLIDDARYLKLVARTVSNVAATPGRQVQSVAQASFDAWVKYYRVDENTPNATISYYAKGALVALALDLTLRAEGRCTLDDVMRRLWLRSAGGPIAEADIAAALEAVSGRSFVEELQRWVHGIEGKGDADTGLPLRRLLEGCGVEWQQVPPTLAQRLGVRVTESALTGVKVTHVQHEGRMNAAERAGLASGDEILGLGGWRLRRLDDALRLLQPGDTGELLVVRDQRLLRLPLTMPPLAAQAGAVALRPTAQAPVGAGGQALTRSWLVG